jgi:hypothetical protein
MRINIKLENSENGNNLSESLPVNDLKTLPVVITDTQKLVSEFLGNEVILKEEFGKTNASTNGETQNKKIKTSG